MYLSKGIRTLMVAAAAVLVCSCSGIPKDGAELERWDPVRQEIDLSLLSMIASEDYPGIISLTDSLIAAGVRDTRLVGQRALALGKSGMYDEATELYEETLLKDYASCENHLNFAVMLMESGKTGRAMTEFTEARKFCAERNQAMILRNLAVADLKMERLDGAMRRIEEGLTFDGSDPYLLGMKGMLLAESNPSMAESLFVRSGREDELPADFLYQLGLIMMRTGRASLAVEPLRQAVILAPGQSEVMLNYIEAMMRSGRWEESGALLEKMREDGSDGEAAAKLARVYFKQGRFDEALAVYGELPPSPETGDRIAMCLFNLGRLDAALEIERKVAGEKPGWTVAMVNLAAILAGLGELEEAREILEEVVRLEPDNAAAVVNLEILRTALEKQKR